MSKNSQSKATPNKGKKVGKPSSSVKTSVRKIALKPSTRSGARFGVVSIQTKVPEIVVSFASKTADENIGAFLKPIVDQYTNDVANGGPSPEMFNVQYICPRRSGESNKAKKISPELSYDWEALVTINDDEDVSAPDIGENLAERFSIFESEKYEAQKFVFKLPDEDEIEKPLNHYLLDWDCVVLLRTVYSNEPKEVLAEDEDVMTNFFGSPEIGAKVLKNVSNFKWESIF